MRLRDAIDSHPLLAKYTHCLSTAELIPAEFRPSGMNPPQQAAHARTVRKETAPCAPLPDFTGFHRAFLDHAGAGDHPTREGDVRRAYFLSYDDTRCEYLQADEVGQRMEAGQPVVSATFVAPYPPGFPVLVPGQLFSKEILEFMRSLDTPEVHGYDPQAGYRVYTGKALEIAQDEP